MFTKKVSNERHALSWEKATQNSKVMMVWVRTFKGLSI